MVCVISVITPRVMAANMNFQLTSSSNRTQRFDGSWNYFLSNYLFPLHPTETQTRRLGWIHPERNFQEGKSKSGEKGKGKRSESKTEIQETTSQSAQSEFSLLTSLLSAAETERPVSRKAETRLQAESSSWVWHGRNAGSEPRSNPVLRAQMHREGARGF